MNHTDLEYIRSLKPDRHPDGRELHKEGLEIGESIEAGRSRFIKESNGKYKTHIDYKKDCMRDGKIIWHLVVGRATLEEQIEALKIIHNHAQKLGVTPPVVQTIPSCLIALPKEYRENAPVASTSYIMDGYEDYEAQVNAAPLEVLFCDHHLASPNALESTINAVKAGSARIGEFTQFYWNHPGFNDNMKRYSDMVRALGVMASKRDEMFAVETYLDDGFPGYFIDCVSYVGYTLFEHYICSTLCNARYSVSYGGLLTEGATKSAIAMAIHELLSTEEQSAISYFNGSTNFQWDHDIHGNYGVSVQELLFAMLVEKKYRMGMAMDPIAVTEKVAVPTLEEQLEIWTAGLRAEEKLEEWLPFVNFTPLEKMRDVMVEQGRIFFENVLKGFKEAGIDIEDPLELILAMKKFNPVKFEMIFHPSVAHSKNGEINPFYPTALGRQTVEMREEIINELKTIGLEGKLKGKKIILGSGDCHTYGLLLVDGVLTAMGAAVINAGVDMDPVDMLDIADEEATEFIGVSCHNGQALDYGRQLLQLAKERNKKYFFFMGGKLNAILPGHSVPTGIEHMLKELGILATNDLAETVQKISEVS